MEKEFYNWKAIDSLSRQLAWKIINSGFKPQILVAVIRGGLFPALIISHELDNKELYAVKCIHYKDLKHQKAELVFQQDIPKKLCKGKRVLIIDEVADSGESLELIKKILKKQKPKSIKTAVLHKKSGSIHKPDYFMEETKAWIVYPWEKR